MGICIEMKLFAYVRSRRYAIILIISNATKDLLTFLLILYIPTYNLHLPIVKT